MTTGDWLALGAMVAGTALVLAAGAARGRVLAAALAAAAGLGALWALALVLTLSGWRDADGWVDCYPRCSPLQDVTGVVLVFGGALAAGLLIAAAIAAGVKRLR